MSGTVFIVDDDLEFTVPVEAALQARGYTVEVLEEASLERLRVLRPTALVICAELARGSGFSMCSRIRKDRELGATPILLTSEASTDEVLEKHAERTERANLYARKPLPAERAVALIEQLLDGAPPPLERGSELDVPPPLPASAPVSAPTAVAEPPIGPPRTGESSAWPRNRFDEAMEAIGTHDLEGGGASRRMAPESRVEHLRAQVKRHEQRERALQRLVREMNQRGEELARRLSGTELDLEQSRTRLEDVEDEKTTVESKLIETEESFRGFHEEVTRIFTEKDAEEAERRSLHDRLAAELASARERHATELGEAQERHADDERRLAFLHEELETVLKRVDEAEARAVAQQRRSAEAQSRAGEMERRAAENEQRAEVAEARAGAAESRERDSRGDLDGLRARLRTVEAVAEERAEAVADLEERLDQQRVQAEAHGREMDALRAEHGRAMEGLRSEHLLALGKTRAAAEEDRKRLEGEHAQKLESIWAEWEVERGNARRSSETQIGEAEQKVRAAEERADRAELRGRQFEERLRLAEQSAAEHHKALRVAEAELEEGQEAVFTLRDGFDRLKAKLAESEANQGALLDRLNQAGAQRQALEARLGTVEGEREAFLNKLEKLQGERNLVLKQLESVQAEKAAAEKALASAREEREAFEQKIDVAHGERGAIQDRLEGLLGEREVLRKRLEAVQGERGLLQRRYDSVHKERETYHAGLESLRSEHTALKTRLGKVNGEREALQAKFEAVQGERSTLQVRLDSAQRERAALLTKLESSQAETEARGAEAAAGVARLESKLRDRLLEAEAAAEAARADAARSAQRAVEAEHRSEEIQRELSSAEEEVERQSEAVLELYARIDELRAELGPTPARPRALEGSEGRLQQLEAMAEASERGRLVAEQALAQRTRELEALLEENRTRAAITLEELESNDYPIRAGEPAPFAALVDEMSRSSSSVQLGGSAALLSPAGTHESDEDEDDRNDREVTEIMNLRKRDE